MSSKNALHFLCKLSCIIGCTNKGTKGMSKKFHRIPKVVKIKGNEVKELTKSNGRFAV